MKARRVGDTVTIRLAERTQASKSASTDAKKDSTIDTGFPILLGGTVTLNGDEILNNEWETTQEFEGEGNSSQSNRLDGNITVTVAEVYPNGNLLVRGEKWLTLNQGEEFVQISGIVRPVDIGADNSVPSFKVADARITYSGKGTLADANQPGPPGPLLHEALAALTPHRDEDYRHHAQATRTDSPPHRSSCWPGPCWSWRCRWRRPAPTASRTWPRSPACGRTSWSATAWWSASTAPATRPPRRRSPPRASSACWSASA